MKTDNELIAEFMGHSTHAYADRETYFDDPAKRRYFGDPMRERLSVALDLQYDKSWDFLMSVWIKFRDLNLKNEEYDKWIDSLQWYLFSSDEPKTFAERLVYAIKWYNSQLTTQKQTSDSAGNSDSLK